jgi:DNA-directed RNA polymerase specialized sigma24 family protein
MSPHPNSRHSFTSEQIESCVGSLSDRYLDILRLSLTERYPTIADRLGIKLGTVKSRLNRARRMLSNALETNAATEQSR